MASSTDELRKFVKRYTTLASALDILQNGRLTLLSPSSWPDRNDAYFLKLYEEHLKDQSVLALCCTSAPERSNHWDTFGSTMEGICIEFKRKDLERVLKNVGATFGPVTYLSNNDLEGLKAPKLQDLAFFKRNAYKNEREWRAIKLCPGTGVVTAVVPIELEAISKIILSPRMPQAVKDSVKEVIRRVPGCKDLRITRSSIYNSSRWQRVGKRIAELSVD